MEAAMSPETEPQNGLRRADFLRPRSALRQARWARVKTYWLYDVRPVLTLGLEIGESTKTWLSR